MDPGGASIHMINKPVGQNRPLVDYEHDVQKVFFVRLSKEQTYIIQPWNWPHPKFYSNKVLSLLFKMKVLSRPFHFTQIHACMSKPNLLILRIDLYFEMKYSDYGK